MAKLNNQALANLNVAYNAFNAAMNQFEKGDNLGGKTFSTSGLQYLTQGLQAALTQIVQDVASLPAGVKAARCAPLRGQEP